MFDEYNDFEEFDNSEEIREAAERAREAFIIRAVQENYKRITAKGFTANNIKEFTLGELKEVRETIEYMIEYFEADEQYEKCAVLVRALNAVNNQEDFEPVFDIY